MSMKLLQPGVWLESDDQEVKATLLAYGKITAMLEADALALPRRFIAWQTRRAAFCVCHCVGYQDAQDNGYVLLVVDKQVHKPETVFAIVNAFTNSGRDNSMPHEPWREAKEDQTVN